MNYKNLYFIAHKSNKGISKKIIFIIIITLLFLLIFIPFTFYKTYSNAITELLNSNYDMRILQIESSAEEIKDLHLEKNKHVVKVMPQYTLYQWKSGRLKEFDSSDSLYINPNIKTFTPKVIKGNKLKNKFDLVCPSRMTFGEFDDQNINDFIDMEQYLNKEFTITFKKKAGFNQETQEYIYESYDYTFKLVGLYDAGLTYSYSTCYAKEDTLNEIIETTYPFDAEKYNQSIGIYVDDYKNVDEIANLLTENNIDFFRASVSTDFLDVVLKCSFVIMILAIVFSIILLMVYINIFIKERQKNLALYKALGYKLKEIKTILFDSVLELLLYAFIISVVILFILKYIILFIVKDNATYQFLHITISYIPILLYILIILVIFKFIINRKVKKYYSYSVKEIDE